LDFVSYVKQQEAMKSGTMKKQICYTTIPNHTGDMPEGTLRAILKQAGISPEEFLNIKKVKRSQTNSTN
jgi:ABC-type uncharacterized transport system fused permease/ATPase subunit